MSKFPGYIFPGGTGGGGTGGGGGTNSSGFVSGGAITNVDPFEFTAEAISGGKAVALNNSGQLVTAMAGTSGRFPSIGITLQAYSSGQLALIYRDGPVFNSTLFNFSGWTTNPVYLGLSGDLIASGAPQASGNNLQIIGQVINGSGLEIQIGDGFESFVGASGDVGSGAVFGQLAGGFYTVASGSIGTYDCGSGITVRNSLFTSVFQSGTAWSLITEEIVSGIRAVQISPSGNIRIAKASISGTMPAIGIVVDNVASGIPANVYTWGAFQAASGLCDFSGYLGKPVFVGRSGQLVTFSGSFNSGGLGLTSGGDFLQKMGVAYNSGAFVALVDMSVLQNQLIGVTDLIDISNRNFGV